MYLESSQQLDSSFSPIIPEASSRNKKKDRPIRDSLLFLLAYRPVAKGGASAFEIPGFYLSQVLKIPVSQHPAYSSSTLMASKMSSLIPTLLNPPSWKRFCMVTLRQ